MRERLKDRDDERFRDRPPELDRKRMRPTRLSLIHNSLIKPESSPTATQQDRQTTS
jgi:hypothetical protein